MTVTRDVLMNSNFKYCFFVVGCGYESYDNHQIENLLSDIIESKYKVCFKVFVVLILSTRHTLLVKAGLILIGV